MLSGRGSGMRERVGSTGHRAGLRVRSIAPQAVIPASFCHKTRHCGIHAAIRIDYIRLPNMG
jgi:hypothetical protein